MDCKSVVRVTFYGECLLVSRSVVLGDLDYQYEGTEEGRDGLRYDIYSNWDGDYFAVKENDNDN